jgi:hypothetical protein
MRNSSVSIRSLRVQTYRPGKSPGKKNLCENGVSIIVAERILDLAPLVGQIDMVLIAVVEQQPLCENRGVNNMQMELVDDTKYIELFDAEREKLECWPNDNPNTRYYHLLTGLESLKTFVEDRKTPEQPMPMESTNSKRPHL